MSRSRIDTRGKLAVGLALVVVAATVGLFLLSFSRSPVSGNGEALDRALWLLVPLVAAVGSLLILTQRGNNAVGWLLMVSAVGTAATTFGVESLTPIAEEPAAIDAGLWLLLWFDSWSWILTLFPMVAIVLVFPNGRLVSPRWRWLLWLELGLIAFLMLLGAFGPTMAPSGGWDGVVPWMADNPVGILPSTWDAAIGIAWVMGFLTLLVGTSVSVVVRYRRADPIERHQLKWLLFSFSLLVLVLLVSGLLPGAESLPEVIALDVALLSLPVAIAVAVLRYRLYDIDAVISRTLVWSGNAILMAGFYLSLVAFLGVVGIGISAVLFQPARRWLQRVASRIVYGKRATPYEVLSDLTQALNSVESSKGLLDRTARRLGEATAAEAAAVWVAVGPELRPVGWWPEENPATSPLTWESLPGHVTSIGPEDQPLGALTVVKRRGDPVTPTEQRLIEDLAGSSASVLHNAVLVEELTERAAELAASRRRLMEVQDSERRRMEQELDEGAQQLVVSLKVKLNVAARLARTEGAETLATLLDSMDNEAREAITQIRSLARGLYPPLLEAEGLETAVRALVEASPARVSMTSDLGADTRFPLELEAAIFFSISEALTNATKHAGAEAIAVSLERSGQVLTFLVSDSGPGFDPTALPTGSGLRNMADRLDAVGGNVEIVSAPGQGARIRGVVPLARQSGVLEPVGG
ncbi:MAG TPA: ATP-binding protein [Acidimicrobiia bacterium]|nr:ATP-binding protein [Acidimicrobiia bacterium]